MNETDAIRAVQESLLALIPVWHHSVVKPMKQALENGISLEMYYCLQCLRCEDGPRTMSELAHWLQVPKQQMTKLSNRLVECQLVERIDDPSDRRIVRIRMTEKGLDYINNFLDHDAKFFQRMLEGLDEQKRQDLKGAADTMLRILFDSLS